jgi:hypothetical protein
MRKMVIVKNIKVGKEFCGWESDFRMSPFSRARCEENDEPIIRHFVKSVEFDEVKNEPKGEFEVVKDNKMKVFIPADIVAGFDFITAEDVFDWIENKLFVKVDIEDPAGNWIGFEKVAKDELENRPDIKTNGVRFWRLVTDEEWEEVAQFIE